MQGKGKDEGSVQEFESEAKQTNNTDEVEKSDEGRTREETRREGASPLRCEAEGREERELIRSPVGEKKEGTSEYGRRWGMERRKETRRRTSKVCP